MADITVDIQQDFQSGTLKVKWRSGIYARGHYSVRQKLIQEESDDVRVALQELVDAGREGRAADYPALTHKVAEKGYALYEDLFSGVTQEDRDSAKRVQERVIRHYPI